MLTEESMSRARHEIAKAVASDLGALKDLRQLVRDLKRPTRIQPRTATTISFVGTDGGHNVAGLNPFMAQLMRVVDSNNHEHCMEVLSSNTSLSALDAFHRANDTPLLNLMTTVGVTSLSALARVFSKGDSERSPSWIQVYRHITEWAVLLRLVQQPFASDTLIVWDGPLRTKVFAPGLFSTLVDAIDRAIVRSYKERRRRIFIVGVTKQSKVLERFRLALALERTMSQIYPCFLELSGTLIRMAIDWDEYLSQRERESAADYRRRILGEENASATRHDKFSAGQMFFVKFGSRPSDSVWAADIWESQAEDAQTIFGYLLNDAANGFPIPLFPMCLQRAHDNAALVDFDMDLFHHSLATAMRAALGDEGPVLDRLALQQVDPAQERYG